MPLTADTWPDSGTDSGCVLTPTYTPLLPAHPPAAWQAVHQWLRAEWGGPRFKAPDCNREKDVFQCHQTFQKAEKGEGLNWSLWDPSERSSLLKEGWEISLTFSKG